MLQLSNANAEPRNWWSSLSSCRQSKRERDWHLFLGCAQRLLGSFMQASGQTATSTERSLALVSSSESDTFSHLPFNSIVVSPCS